MKLECKICGCEFNPIVERHYISRGEGKTGFAAALAENDETKLFDAFDCPQCGCQIIAQSRKREWLESPIEDDECYCDCCDDECDIKVPNK